MRIRYGALLSLASLTLALSSAVYAVSLEDAKAALARNDLKEAAALLRTRLAESPDDQDSKFMLAKVLAWQKEFAEAEGLISSLLASSPDDADYLLLRAQMLFWQEHLVDALTYAGHARSVAPHYRDVWELELRLRSLISGDKFPPIALAMEFQQRFPAQSLPWPHAWEALEVAEDAIKREDFPLAIVALREYLVNSPTDADAKLKLARVLAWRQDFPAAQAELISLMNGNPDNADYLLLQAQILRWKGETENALPIVERAIRIAPAYYDLWELAFSLHAERSDDSVPPHALVEGFHKQFGKKAIPWTRDAPKRNDVVAASMLYEKLVNSPSHWVDSTLTWRTVEPQRRSMNIEWRSVQRFGMSDSAVAVAMELDLNKRWRLGLTTGGAQTHSLLPSVTAGSALYWRASDVHAFDLAYRFAAYQYSGTDTTRITYRWSHAKLDVAFSSINTIINVTDYAGAGEIRVDYKWRPDHALSCAVTIGDEADVTDTGRLVRNPVRAQSIGWRHIVDKRYAFSAGVVYTDTSPQATRGGGYLGFSFHH